MVSYTEIKVKSWSGLLVRGGFVNLVQLGRKLWRENHWLEF